MNLHKQIAVIAPKRMLSAFSVLIKSVPGQSLVASSDNLEELRTILGEKKPDVILLYLVQESGLDYDRCSLETIVHIKNIWPDVLCVTILKYASQVKEAKEIGSDLALVEGVNAERLLAAIKGKLM
jgi:response regulator of citrate/malate metabolism